MTITSYDLVMLCNGGPYHGETLHVSKDSDRVIIPLVKRELDLCVDEIKHDTTYPTGTYVVRAFDYKGSHWYELFWDSPEQDWDEYL